MKIVTKRDVIKSGVANFLRNYHSSSARNIDFPAIVSQLNLLNTDTCSTEEVDKIIGNTSWTRLYCDECKEPVDSVVQIGANEDYEDACGSAVCMDCLQAAVKKLQPTVIHIKTGNMYNVIGHAINATNEQSGQSMRAYERDGQMYVREAQEWSEKFSIKKPDGVIQQPQQ